MINTLRAILTGAALAVVGWLGWHFGSSGLAEARAELARLEASGKQALAEQQKTQDKLKTDLAEQARQHDSRVEALNQGFDTQKKQLESSLAGVKSRLASVSGQHSQAQGELVAVRARLAALPATATGDQRQQLVQQEVKLVEIERKLSKQALSLECVDAQVPPDLLARLDVGAQR
jgi:chromosome segregation ATPase